MDDVDYPLMRKDLAAEDGTTLRGFVRGLAPRYAVVYRDIALGYLGLIGAALLVAAAPALGVPPLAGAVLGAWPLGYAAAYIALFLHEAAHGNLARRRAVNDRLCDGLVSWLTGTGIADYRIVHLAHHSAFGTPADTERTYFRPLDLGFVVRALGGVQAIAVLRHRHAVLAGDAGARRPSRPRRPSAALCRSLATHGAILAAALAAGAWWLALAWLLAIGVVLPFLGATRQLLEHRRPDADDRLDYAVIAHGGYTRLFGDGPIASTFGGAGFNRHLLHHWEPQVSYTNLPALERFLAGTPLRPVLDARRDTYLGAARRLFRRRWAA